ncbi:hypothetical protein GCM10023095_06950 [Pseudaeromonas paramecii]|uniref:Uncharacterized protein n=1 Tax=Pseudaeromonas paramecii TaxID=2138166 RepID=A0ABP8Q0R5_9GAMM
MVHHPGQTAGQRDRHTRSQIFLAVDPDQPIVTGRTFHATNRPPYAPPEHKIRTVLRTETHQGEGFNEPRCTMAWLYCFQLLILCLDLPIFGSWDVEHHLAQSGPPGWWWLWGSVPCSIWRLP